jgi:hypothetical protein
MDINAYALPNGTILKPHGEHKEWNPVIDQYLESFRPQGMLSRHQAVFMVDSIWTLPDVGMDMEDGWVYEVNPMGKVENHDVGWYVQLHHLFDGIRNIEELQERMEWDDSYDIGREYASNYWHGVDFGEGAWEYLTPSAKIIDYKGSWEDLMHAAVNEMKHRAGI